MVCQGCCSELPKQQYIYLTNGISETNYRFLIGTLVFVIQILNWLFYVYICFFFFFLCTPIVSFSNCAICKVTLVEHHLGPSASVVLEVKRTRFSPAQHKRRNPRFTEGYLEWYPTGIWFMSIFKYIPGDNTESQVSFSLSLFAWLQKLWTCQNTISSPSMCLGLWL